MNASSWHKRPTFHRGRTYMSGVRHVVTWLLLIHLLWHGRLPFARDNSTTSQWKCHCYRTSTLKPSISTPLSKPFQSFSDETANRFGNNFRAAREYIENPAHGKVATGKCETKNVLAQLTGVEDRLKWLREISTDAKNNPSAGGTRVLYLVNGDACLNHLSQRLYEDGDFSGAVNIISYDRAQIDKDAAVTITTYEFIGGCCNFLHNGGHYDSGNIDANSLQPYLSQCLTNYSLLDDEKASKLNHLLRDTVLHFIEPKDVLDTESITLDNVPLYLDGSAYVPILERISEMHTKVDLVARAFSGSDSIVFDCCTSGRSAAVFQFCESLTSVLCKIKRQHRLLFFFDDFFFSWQWENWMKAVFGSTSAVTLSNPGHFAGLTSRGSFNLFSDERPIPSSAFKKATNFAASNCVDPLAYAQEYSSAVTYPYKHVPVNRQFDAHAVDVVLEALKNKGITTRGHLAHFSKSAHDLVKDKEREMMSRLLPPNGRNELRRMVECMMDSNRFKLMRPLIHCCNLSDAVDKLELPTAHDIIEYVKEKNLYPTLILNTCRDIPKDEWLKESMQFPVDKEMCETLRKHGLVPDELLSRGIAFFDLESSYELRMFIAWYPHLFKIISTDRSITCDPQHLLVMRDYYLVTKMRHNAQVLSNVKKARLTTFCGGLFSWMLHVAAKLRHPACPHMGTIADSLLQTIEYTQTPSQRSFKHYMNHAARLYYERYPDFAKDRVTISFEQERLGQSVDTDYLKRLIHLRKCCGHFTKMFRRFKRPVHYVLANKSWALQMIHKHVPLVNSTVQAIDGNEYVISRVFGNHKDVLNCSFSDGFKTAMLDIFTNRRRSFVVLSRAGSPVYYVTPLSFIKDIINFSDSKEPVPLENDVATQKYPLDVTVECLGLTEPPPHIQMTYLVVATRPCDTLQYRFPPEMPATVICPPYVIEAAGNVNALEEPLKKELRQMQSNVPPDEATKRWLQLAETTPVGGRERREEFATLFKVIWGVDAPA